MNYSSDMRQCRRRPITAQSIYMDTEEIWKERQASGWNPYAGEEEGWAENNADYENRQNNKEQGQAARYQNNLETPGHIQMTPYFQQPEYAEVLEDARGEERDLRGLQSMYPEMTKNLLPYVEEACDKMEYEGSMMYDEYPDPESVRKITRQILEETDGREQGQNCMEAMIQILVIQEMHHRRCRHQRCRKNLFN